MKLSTSTSVFVGYPIEAALDLVIQAGFDGVDFWCGRPHLYRKDHTPHALKALRQKIEGQGITVVSLMPAFFRYPFSLSSPNDVVRQDSIEYMRACIENAVMVGSRQVLVVPTHSLQGQSTTDARNRFADSLYQIAPYADQNRILLGIEVLYPKLSDYLCSTEGALELIDELGSSCFGVVLDTGHLNLSGEAIEAALQKVGDRLLQIHVNDNDGQQQQNAIPGDGAFNFSDLVPTLRRYRYEGFLSIELGYQYSFDPFLPVCNALDRMRSLLES